MGEIRCCFTELVHKLYDVLSKVEEGKKLLEDSLKTGDIIIDLTEDNIPHGAHWDENDRKIKIQLSKNELQTIKDDEKLQNKVFTTLLFELCNAANPLTNQGKFAAPLLFDSTEEYTKKMEFAEFKSHQRRVKIHNALCDILKKEGSTKFKVYSDEDFEKYFTEEVDKKTNDNQTHADYYRNAYKHAFIFVRDRVVKTIETCVKLNSLIISTFPDYLKAYDTVKNVIKIPDVHGAEKITSLLNVLVSGDSTLQYVKKVGYNITEMKLEKEEFEKHILQAKQQHKENLELYMKLRKELKFLKSDWENALSLVGKKIKTLLKIDDMLNLLDEQWKAIETIKNSKIIQIIAGYGDYLSSLKQVSSALHLSMIKHESEEEKIKPLKNHLFKNKM